MMQRKITVLLVCIIAAVTLLAGCETSGKNSKNGSELVPASSAISGKPTEKDDKPITEYTYKNQNG